MRRHNYFENRNNQWVIAGKIAVKTGAFNPYDDNGEIKFIYRLHHDIDYALVGQKYLRELGIKINEL